MIADNFITHICWRHTPSWLSSQWWNTAGRHMPGPWKVLELAALRRADKPTSKLVTMSAGTYCYEAKVKPGSRGCAGWWGGPCFTAGEGALPPNMLERCLRKRGIISVSGELDSRRACARPWEQKAVGLQGCSRCPTSTAHGAVSRTDIGGDTTAERRGQGELAVGRASLGAQPKGQSLGVRAEETGPVCLLWGAWMVSLMGQWSSWNRAGDLLKCTIQVLVKVRCRWG